SIEKLEFIKTKKNFLFFKAYSKNLKENISIKINVQDYDEIQIKTLSKYAKLIYAPIYTIEQNGGGSARCMLAEVHLPLR
ncbi:MAG: hypothetical protein EOP00_33830, partial [Pedobacter sp.]